MKKFVFLLIFILIFPIFVFGCAYKEEEKLNVYDIFVDYDNDSHSADCFEKVTYVNVSNNAFESLYFHLYPNAFKENSKKEVVTKTNFEKAYPNGESFGSIVIQSVTIKNQDVNFDISGEDENILEIPLLEKLYPDEKVEICIDFALFLPNINHRFGYGNNTINFGNFYPIACVYDEVKGFKKDLYTSNGDPFCSDVANYNVEIKYDEKLTLASGGQQGKMLKKEGKKTVCVTACDVRDFCFVLSEKFEIIEDEIEGVNVKYYFYDDENAQDSLKTAICALSTFNEMFGEYPYKTLSVVQTSFFCGGMEYPNLVMISDLIKERLDKDYVIVHEIAHQWWYGVVGNDEFNEPWVDESLTEYSTVLFFEKNDYGVDYGKLIENATSQYKFFVETYSKIYENFDTSMNRSLKEFKTEPEYIHLIYTKGVIMYDTLRTLYGEKKFNKAIKSYYDNNKFKIASGEELINCFEKKCNAKIRSIFDSFLLGKVLVK